MQSRIRQWEEAADDKVLFLRCYMMMTGNVLAAIDQQHTFNDPAWVGRLLAHFAEYYFVALRAYEHDPASAPKVWQYAHHAARDPRIAAIQKLFLGVNAHINYDLVLTLADLLRAEWGGYSSEQRARRYADHCRINDIIGRTIDAVQDEVLEPAMPIMDVFDKLLGPFDEMLILRLITRWREKVWRNTAHLLDLRDADEQVRFIRQVEREALETGKLICKSGSNQFLEES